MTTNPLPQRPWATLAMLARHRDVSERSARMWAKKGYLTLYKIHGVRGVVVDLDEANAALDELATKGLINPDYGKFGGQQVQTIAGPVRRRAEVVRKCQRCGIDSSTGLCQDCADVVQDGDR